MKKAIFTLFILATVLCSLNAQSLKDIKLNTPDKTGGMPVMEALANRKSDRAFDSRKLTTQDMSDLLWAANGVNRVTGDRTAPSAKNKKDIDIYVVMEEGIYMYDADSHTLLGKSSGDYRQAAGGGQAFVHNAPAILVLVSNTNRLGSEMNERTKMVAAMDAGIVSQNINLFCASKGLSTVTRASMDQVALKTALKLDDSHLFILNNTVGYPIK